MKFIPLAHHEDVVYNIAENAKRGLPEVQWKPENCHEMVIVGGGPSLADDLQLIRKKKKKGAFISTVNGSHDFLLSKGIKPNACVLLDAHPDLGNLVTPQGDVIYMIASQCNPKTFDRFEGKNVLLFHANTNGGFEDELLGPGHVLVDGGTTGVMRSPVLGFILGFRDFSLFGVDSCFPEGKQHAYEQGETDKFVVSMFGGKEYLSDMPMFFQAQSFIGSVALREVRKHATLKVFGEGLIPDIHRASRKRPVHFDELRVRAL